MIREEPGDTVAKPENTSGDDDDVSLPAIVKGIGRDILVVKNSGSRMTKRKFWSREQLPRLGIILLAVAISVTLFVFRNRLAGLHAYGYLGAFLISLASSATVVLPVPGMAAIIALGDVYNPVLIGLVAAAGSALGEITGYLVGYSGRGVLRESETYRRLEGWTRRRGGIVIFLLALIPNPVFDLGGAAAGVLRYPVWKFLVLVFLGKIPKNILFAVVGVGISHFF